MSLPKQPPSHSSSPSKSAFRSSPSGTRTQKPATVRPLLPSPRFDEEDAALLGRSPAPGGEEEEEEEEDEGEDDIDDGRPERRDPDRSRLFQPFFTLIETTVSPTHHHPTVH